MDERAKGKQKRPPSVGPRPAVPRLPWSMQRVWPTTPLTPTPTAESLPSPIEQRPLRVPPQLIDRLTHRGNGHHRGQCHMADEAMTLAPLSPEVGATSSGGPCLA
jgi:hypothetical protein